jgi:hypothetical protein
MTMPTTTVELSDAKLKLLKARMAEVFGTVKAEWCVACGAGAKAVGDLISNPGLFRDLVSADALTKALGRIDIDSIKGSTDWCVACGAAAVSRPGLMPGPEIDKIIGEVVEILKK